MKKIFLVLLAFLGVFLNVTKGQVIDTLINIGGYNLHLTIIPGKGIPILFESGGGNDATIWKSIIQPIAEVTGATIITYDRPGLGKSTIDSTHIGFENDMKELEAALIKLGYQKRIMLVSHSLGGFYNTMYASRHPKEVKAIVFIDANHPCFFSEDQLNKMKASQNYRNMVETVRKNPVPSQIPVVDIVSERTLFEGSPDADRWKTCHAEFVSVSPNRKAIIAYETGHYVFLANRQLVINAIVTLYANHVMPREKTAILERGYAQELKASNEDRKNLIQYWHSEDDLNEWGYSLLQHNEKEKALEVFKLNVYLHPGSAKAYDSLGEAYLKTGNKELAVQNYKKALELNPNYESAKKALEQILK
jgi:alpha/beta hydrolase fold/Tetratricopeptide repeat